MKSASLTRWGADYCAEFPNPERVGCPPSEVLKGMASHRVPLAEAEKWLDHLGSCSPCYRDFSQFQKTYQLRRKTHAACNRGQHLGLCSSWRMGVDSVARQQPNHSSGRAGLEKLVCDARRRAKSGSQATRSESSGISFEHFAPARKQRRRIRCSHCEAVGRIARDRDWYGEAQQRHYNPSSGAENVFAKSWHIHTSNSEGRLWSGIRIR